MKKLKFLILPNNYGAVKGAYEQLQFNKKAFDEWLPEHDKEMAREERERIHNYIRVLSNSGDLKINDGVLLWDIIQDTLSLKYMQVGLAIKQKGQSGKP